MGRDRIETDVGEKHDGGAGQYPERLTTRSMLSQNRRAEKADAGIAVGSEGMPIFRIDVRDPDDDDQEDNGRLKGNMKAVEVGVSPVPKAKAVGIKPAVQSNGRSVIGPVAKNWP